MTTEIYVNNTKLDLYDDVDIRLNYQINDIREIETRQTNFSYTILIPGTKDNNQLFGHIYELQNDNIIYNPNFKADVQVYVDGNQVFAGFLQLSRIIRQNDDNIDYEVILYGALGSLYADIADDDIEDIDLSEFDHTYSRANIVNSWNTSIIRKGATESFKFGTGYVYPLIQRGINTTAVIAPEELFPAIYTKEIFDRIIAEAGYTYKSEFLNSSYFKKLIIPFTKESIPLTQDQIDARSFFAERTSTNSFLNRVPTIAGTFYTTPLFNTETSDPGGVFNSGYVWSVNKKGRYQIAYSLLISEYFTADAYPFFVVGDNITYQIQLIKNGSIIYTLPGVLTHTSGGHVGPVEFSDYQYFTYDVNAVPGDYYYLRIGFTIPASGSASKFINSGGAAINGNIQFRVKPTSFATSKAYNDGIVESDYIYMNNILPENVKKKDFITSIIKMFNLMILPDASDSKSLIIEPRDSFYRSSGDFNDWTDKMDRTSYEIKPLAELINRTFEYKYKEDTDYYNELYKENTGEVYGQYRYDVENDFVQDKTELELIFSPTPNATDTSTSLSAPHFLSYDNSGLPKPKKANIRILFYDGLKPGNITVSSITAPATQAYSSYPYCGMQNDPINPTEDLAFSYPKEMYYASQEEWTDSNLFNKFHQNTLSEITDKNSKLLTAYFDLSPLDIAKFDFRDKIFIDNVYWRVNKIIDYTPVNNELTKVELFSPVDPYLFVPKAKGIIAGPATGISASNDVIALPATGPVINTKPATSAVNGNLVVTPATGVYGSDNLAAERTSAVIIGDSNTLGSDINAGLVIGSANTISSNVVNAVVLGSNNKNVTSSNVIVLGDSYVIRSQEGLTPIIDLVDGGIDTVQNPFNKVVVMDIVDAGNDAVRELGSQSTVMIVDAGQDIVNPNEQI